jgi:hypothetical protein
MPLNYTLPEDWDNAEDAYKKIECHTGGQYPIGNNHCWHSGVHINGDKPIHPMINGTIIACRLTDSFASIPRRKEIKQADFILLSELEKYLYGDPEGPIPKNGIYSLKKYDKKTFNDLKTKKPEIESMFKEENGIYKPIEEEKISTEYVLVKHEVYFPENKGSNRTINFFILYMGIYTYIGKLKQYYEGFNEIKEKINEKIPFYQRWKFRLKCIKPPIISYKDIGGYKIFEYSTLDYKQKTNGKYECCFTNDKNNKWQDIEQDYFEKIEIKHRVNKKNVEVYKIPTDINTPMIQTTTIKDNVCFFDSKPLEVNKDYYKVIVWQGDINTSNLCGWLVMKSRQEINADNKNSFRLDNDQVVYSIKRIEKNNIFIDYYAIKKKDIYGVKNVSVAELEEVIVYYCNNDSSIMKHYSFFINNKMLKSIKLSSSQELEKIKKQGKTPLDIIIYEWTPIDIFKVSDYVLVDKNNPLPEKIPEEIIKKERLSFCRFSYPALGRAHNAVISTKNLSEEGKGYLKTKTQINTLNNFFDKTINGFILYDSYKDGKPGNAYICLDESSPGLSKEFGMNNPYSLTEKIESKKPYRIIYNNDEENPLYGYLFINDDVTVEVKIEYEEKFKERSSIIKPNIKVKQTDVLGFGAPIPKEKKPFYDLVLYFTDNQFLSEERWEKYPKTYCYEKQENFNELYKLIEKIENRKEIVVQDTLDYPQYKIKLINDEKPETILIKICKNDNEIYYKKLELGKPTGIMILNDNKNNEIMKFFEFKVNQKSYYVEEKEGRPDILIQKNYLDFSKFFIKLSGDDDNIECDHEKIVKKITKEELNFQQLLDLYKNGTDKCLEIRKNLRRLACEHKLEWNKGLYNAEYFNKRAIIGETKEYMENKVGKFHLWANPEGDGETTIEEMPKGKVWLAHPVYFINHLDNARLLSKNADNLRMVQNKIIGLNCLKKGERGMYDKPPESKAQTYCNHAVFLTVIATDRKYFNFTGKIKTNPKAIEYPFPEIQENKRREYEKKYYIKSSNFWCDELERFANEEKIVRLLDPKEAQLYANLGYTVVASYRANKDRENVYEISPHFATVRPGWECHESFGPRIANVGENNLFGWTKDQKCFGEEIFNSIKWYYNPNQEFYDKPDMDWINTLK